MTVERFETGVAHVMGWRASTPGPTVALVARIHGNEPVGDGVIDRFVAEAEARLTAGKVLLVRANVAATEANVRHTPDGVDMNRLWDRDTLARLATAAADTLCYEERRVAELAPILASAQVVLDLHSTSRPSFPHLVFRDDQQHSMLARRMGVRHLVTGVFENGILSGGICSNIGLAPGERGERVGFTLEAGQHTDPGNAARAWDVAQRLLGAFGMWVDPPPVPPGLEFELYEVLDRFRQAPAGTVQYRFVGYEGGETGEGRQGPPRSLASFEDIEADEVVLRRGHEGVLRAGTSFTMLMPAPATPPGTDLYYQMIPRRGGLSEGVARTHEEARREALAIERMFDLLSDDELGGGASWIAFDDRRLYDLSATVVGRALRLPVGHPHRRITVLGRGSASADETERRAGQRYRQAMRRAVVEGLPMERFQLLKGATLGWFDSLCSSATGELLDRRRTHHPEAARVGVALSLHQPRSVSLAVAGDLDLALESGDVRHVRVVLGVEAATVEADGGTARLRVARASLTTSRREVLVAARQLIDGLRQEHRTLLADVLRHDDLEGAVDPATGLLGTSSEYQEAMRAAFYRLQLDRWLASLRTEIVDRQTLKSPEEVGRFLARTMAATGILDAQSLAWILFRRHQGRTLVDPDRLLELDEARFRPDGGIGFFAEAPKLVLGRPNPPQPLFANDVDANDLERWVGWMRGVANTAKVAATRGKDLDVLYDAEAIRHRLASMMESARKRAADAPGDVVLVLVGDGQNPGREPGDAAWSLLAAHRAALADPRLRYTRIQHARSTHVSWLKDFATAAEGRRAGAQPFAMQWEPEHASAVHVALVGVRYAGAPPLRHDSLDGVEIVAAAVLLNDLRGDEGLPYPVGWFTERSSELGIHHELVAFARAHCQDLWSQGGPRVTSEAGPPAPGHIADVWRGLVARWVDEARRWARERDAAPEEVLNYLHGVMGLVDPVLGAAVMGSLHERSPGHEVAREVWGIVEAWPGRTRLAERAP